MIGSQYFSVLIAMIFVALNSPVAEAKNLFAHLFEVQTKAQAPILVRVESQDALEQVQAFVGAMAASTRRGLIAEEIFANSTQNEAAPTEQIIVKGEPADYPDKWTDLDYEFHIGGSNESVQGTKDQGGSFAIPYALSRPEAGVGVQLLKGLVRITGDSDVFGAMLISLFLSDSTYGYSVELEPLRPFVKSRVQPSVTYRYFNIRDFPFSNRAVGDIGQRKTEGLLYGARVRATNRVDFSVKMGDLNWSDKIMVEAGRSNVKDAVALPKYSNRTVNVNMTVYFKNIF